MAAAILDFRKPKILTDIPIGLAVVQLHTKFYEDRLNDVVFIANFRFFKMAAAAILFF